MESSPQSAQRVDVLVGGAGFAGLALAIALRQGLGPSFSVSVADPALARPANDGRASAIVAAARRLFETIGVWQEIEAQPICDMVVTDSRLTDVVRPVFLTFDIDFVDPGFAPGTGTPEVGGPSSRDALRLVRGLRGLDLVGFDMVEVQPQYDHGEVTSLLAGTLLHEFLTLVALNRGTL